MSYTLHYVVEAATKLEAITKATAMLRTDVRLRGVLSASPTAGPFWDVHLSVWEDA